MVRISLADTKGRDNWTSPHGYMYQDYMLVIPSPRLPLRDINSPESAKGAWERLGRARRGVVWIMIGRHLTVSIHVILDIFRRREAVVASNNTLLICNTFTKAGTV